MANKTWVSTKEVLDTLGISKTHLYQLRKEQFKHGIHYRDLRSKNAMRATYKWNVNQIEQLLNSPAEQRL